MKKTDVIQPVAMASAFAEGVYSATSTTNFEIPAATSTSASDTCVLDDGFLPITSTDIEDGGIAPERKNFNGMFYLSTDQRFFLQNGGCITYNSSVATAIGGYPQDAVLQFIDSNGTFRIVQSLIDDNTNNFVSNESLIDGVHWKDIQFGGGGVSSNAVGVPIITLSSTLSDNEIWLEGSTVSRTTYSNLFAIYGTTYGSGNGSTTFTLPDFRGRAIWGSNSFGYISAGLPNITGSIYNNASGADYQWGDVLVSDVVYSGALSPIQSSRSRHTVGNTTASNTPWDGISFNASSSSSIYGSSSTVQPPAIRVRVKTRYQ